MQWREPQAAELAVLESLDGLAPLRNGLKRVAAATAEWAGIPLPIDGIDLVVEPRYPNAAKLMEMFRELYTWLTKPKILLSQDWEKRMETSKGSGHPLEDLDGAFREVGELFQRFNDRLTFKDLRLSERYAEGRVNVLVYAKWDSVHFSIIFERANPLERIGGPTWEHHGHPICAGPKKPNPSIGSLEDPIEPYLRFDLKHCRCYGYDSVMLVNDIEPMKAPHRVMPSWASIQPHYAPFPGPANSLYFSYSRGFFHPAVLGEWKPPRVSFSTGVQPNEIANSAVQGSSEIVNDVSNDDAPLQWDLFLDRYADDLLTGLWIFISEQGVWNRVHERLKCRLKILDVAFGPFNL